MCKPKFGPVLFIILSLLAYNLNAQTCPTDAVDTGVALTMAALRVNPDGSTTPLGPNPAGICETLRFRMLVAYQPVGPAGKTAFFEGGTMVIRNLNGTFTDDVTPAGGVPLIGEPTDPQAQACGPNAVRAVLSDQTVNYTINPADIDAQGNITFLAGYVGGRVLFGAGITNQPTGTTAIQVHVDRGPNCTIAPASQEVCLGGTATFTVTGTGEGGPPFTFSWTGPGGFTAVGPTITVGVAGTYTATVTDVHGCTSTCTAVLIVNPPPACVITIALNDLCVGSTATFAANVTGGTPPFGFLWSGPNGFSATGANVTRANVQLGDLGDYRVVVTDAKGCISDCLARLNIVPCVPDVEVTKEVACYLPGNTCGPYSKLATGVRNSECPAFCFRISIRNADDDTIITVLNVTDTLLGNISAAFADALPLVPGEVVTREIKAVTLCQDTTNVVTALGRTAQGFEDVDTDSAVGHVLNINVECDLTLFSSFDMDTQPTDNHVTLPAGSVDVPVEFNFTVRNTGTSSLTVTNITGLPALIDCASGAPITVTLPFDIAAGGESSLSACTLVSCPGASFSVRAFAVASDEGGTRCVFDENGNRVADATDVCPGTVICETAVTCRVTGGGVLLPETTDESCITVNTTIFPTAVKITHGGQLGAPFAQEDCGEVLGNPCIRGQWQHTRHYQGLGNPRDVIDMNFHSVTPKGVFDSLNCACLGCCDPETGAFITPITVGSLCNPDDHKVCGPQPRPAPANAIIFSGIGRLTPEDDARGPRADRSEWVIFRVYIEDRSEPGGHHPGGAVEPADIYSFTAWKTGIKTTRKPDFSTVSPDFRHALGVANCQFLSDLQSGAKPIGSLPPTEVMGMQADIVDQGPLSTGNQQIHPSTSATCE